MGYAPSVIALLITRKSQRYAKFANCKYLMESKMTEREKLKEWLKTSPFMWTIIDSVSDNNAIVVEFEVVQNNRDAQQELPLETT
jgi:hypothetical protein